MIKSRLLIAALAIVSMFSGHASATYMTTNAEFYAKDPSTNNLGANPPVIDIISIGFSGGQVWTNQVTSPNGAFGSGGIVRTVGALGVGNMRNGSVVPVQTPDGSPIHAVFAVEGQIVSPGTASFSAGSIYFVASDTGNPFLGGFDPSDPTSFNFGNAFAKFDLAPAMEVTDGFAAAGIHSSSALTFPGFAANKSTIDLFGQSGSGFFAFMEDASFVPAGGFANPGLGANVGAAWMSNLEGNSLGFEGLSVITDQSVDQTPLTLTALQEAALNTIAVAALGSAFSGVGFEFDPRGKNSATPTGDFSADLSADAAPITLVPEPASLCVFGLAFLAVGGFRHRRS